MTSNNNGVRILGIGVATMDVYLNQRRMYPGGNEYNIACHVVNCGAYGGFLGVFADDKAGALLEQTLVRTGVDCSKSHHESGSSGFSLVKLKEDGDRVFLYWNQKGVTDVHPIEFSDDEMEYVKSFDVCCLGRCASVSFEKLKFLSESGIPLCYDFHAIYDKETIDRIAPLVKYAFLSCSHLSEEETKEYLKYVVSKGCEIAVGTRGADKFFAYDGCQYFEQEPFKTKARDALGAGDSFIAAFLTTYLSYKKGINPTNRKAIEKLLGARTGNLSPEDIIRNSLIAAAYHASQVVKVDGSIGIYFDIAPDRIAEVINIENEEICSFL